MGLSVLYMFILKKKKKRFGRVKLGLLMQITHFKQKLL